MQVGTSDRLMGDDGAGVPQMWYLPTSVGQFSIAAPIRLVHIRRSWYPNFSKIPCTFGSIIRALLLSIQSAAAIARMIQFLLTCANPTVRCMIKRVPCSHGQKSLDSLERSSTEPSVSTTGDRDIGTASYRRASGLYRTLGVLEDFCPQLFLWKVNKWFSQAVKFKKFPLRLSRPLISDRVTVVVNLWVVGKL